MQWVVLCKWNAGQLWILSWQAKIDSNGDQAASTVYNIMNCQDCKRTEQIIVYKICNSSIHTKAGTTVEYVFVFKPGLVRKTWIGPGQTG